MASVYDDIRATLETYLSNTSGIPDIAYENVTFEPTTGQSFLRCQLFPTRRRPAVRGPNPQQRYDGVFTVYCYCPEGVGPGTADALANTIIERFDATTDITVSGFTVSIDYAEREQGISSQPFYYVPVNIGWYHYAK